MTAFVTALKKKSALSFFMAPEQVVKEKINTLYFGGGSPSIFIGTRPTKYF
jgi:coproporphyrinogen III oxidase-like Fe-S oxidoreductase